MVSEPIELFGPKSMAVEEKPLIGMQKEQQETKHTRKLRRLKYSCEEVYERMDNGLCIFCDELNTPGHHDLKHKGIQIFMVECDEDRVSDYEEEAHQVHETLTNPAPIKENVYLDKICDEKELVSIDLVQQEVQTKTVAEEKLNLPNGQNIEHLVGKNFETFSTEYKSFLNISSSDQYQKDSTWIKSSLYLFFSLKDDRIWEPGGLPTKMDYWDWFEKELKPYGESHKVATFLYSQMQVVKSNLAEFNTFDIKRSNRTLSLEDKQGDEHEQNQVRKLISSWKNRIWERGKLLATHLYWELFGLNPLIGLEIYSWECKKQLRSEKSPFQCTYAAQIKRCGETARQIFFLTDQMSKTGVLAKQMLVKECDIDLDNVEAESPLLQEEKATDSTKQIIIWIIFKELCSAGYEWENETIKENFIELSKLEKDHEPLSPENLDVHILYLFRKGGFIEFSGCHTHLKKPRAALERLPQEVSKEWAKRIVIGKCLEHIFFQKSEIIILMFWGQMFNVGQKIAGGLIYGDVTFHLKHKWRSRLLQTCSRLEFCVDSVILFTSSVKLLFPKNHKLLHYEAEFCAQYNDLKQFRTESQSSPGLDYFVYLIFLWNQALNCGCEAGHISSGFFFVGDVHEFLACSKLQNGDERYGKRLLDVNEISLLDSDNQVDFTIKACWCYYKPMIREVFHLQRPPELIDLHGKSNFITKVLVQWKEHPPDQFFSVSQCQGFNLSSLRTRMF